MAVGNTERPDLFLKSFFCHAEFLIDEPNQCGDDN